jgi:mannose-6-phosphate isomerase-like protein (cupin superfamily)
MKVRRVITGHDSKGTAVFVNDAEVVPLQPKLLPGFAWHWLWGVDEIPHRADDGARPGTMTFYPAVNGVRFGLLTLPPDTMGVPEDLDLAEARAELASIMPGLAEHMDPDDPGMHRTATCDFAVVLSGEVCLELDDGATVLLAPGDAVVQNGTRHRWSNPRSKPAVLAFVMCGAQNDNAP